MALPNDSHVGATAASGTTFPTHLVSGKEYPVGMTADADGQVDGSLPAYGFIVPPAAAGASKIYFDFFNAQAASIVRLRGLWAITATDVAVTGLVGVRLDFMRINAVGTGGTAFAANPSSSKTAAAFWNFDPAGTALAAGITGRVTPTGGATDQAWLWNGYFFTEETNVSAQISQFYNLIPQMPKDQPIELPTGYGLKVVQGTVASVGNIGFLGAFSVS